MKAGKSRSLFAREAGGMGIPRGSAARQGIVFDLSVLNRVYNFV